MIRSFHKLKHLLARERHVIRDVDEVVEAERVLRQDILNHAEKGNLEAVQKAKTKLEFVAWLLKHSDSYRS